MAGRLPEGDCELYSHPSLDEGLVEFEALVDPRVKACLTARGIRLVRYQDLSPADARAQPARPQVGILK